jgi:hypothetical protein
MITDAFQLTSAFAAGTILMVIGTVITLVLTSAFETCEEA